MPTKKDKIKYMDKLKIELNCIGQKDEVYKDKLTIYDFNLFSF